ncbi:hypothetical protein IQ07DRAFT_680764 [Pyrenochaeta sp. DS3sAY3a]|nr:hypothetical protein IQ07DRAFT_680764 [Pyrenochaeta sp. DS3sAY3a]
MNGAFYQSAGYVPPGGTEKEKQRRQDQWAEWQRQQTSQRESMSDILEEPHSCLAASKITSRKRADSLSPPLTSSRITPKTDTPAYSTTDSMHRQSLDADHQYARRFSSAEEYNSPWRSPMQASQPEIRRLSGNFNAPTCVELERHKDYRRRSKGMDKIKNAVRGWVRA